MRAFRLSLIVVMTFVGVAARGDEPDWKARLAAAVSRAVAQNPSIVEMEARIEAARQRVEQADALPDTEIEVGIQDIPPSDFSFSRDDFTMEKILARQAFPAAGKRPARTRFAEAEVAATEAEHMRHVVELAAEVADAFFALAGVDARSRILQASRERLRSAASAASERYRVGKGPQADVLRANLEVTSAEEKLLGIAAERRAAAARFNTLQALSSSVPVAPVELPADAPRVPGFETALAQALSESPGVAAAEASVRRAEERLELARLERRPDFIATAYYAARVDYDDFIGAFVGLSLPFLQPGRLKAREAEGEADLSGARAGLSMARNDIEREAAEAYAELERALEQSRLYASSILPQAESTALAAREAYVVGQVDFLTYIRSALDLDAYAAELADRRSQAWRAAAAVQRATGLSILPLMPEVTRE
ncbi:MAG: TolC family protein [Thermoanaerobaculia bacterium]